MADHVRGALMASKGKALAVGGLVLAGLVLLGMGVAHAGEKDEPTPPGGPLPPPPSGGGTPVGPSQSEQCTQLVSKLQGNQIAMANWTAQLQTHIAAFQYNQSIGNYQTAAAEQAQAQAAQLQLELLASERASLENQLDAAGCTKE